MLEVPENEISLHKWSDGTAHLRTLKGTLLLSNKRICQCKT